MKTEISLIIPLALLLCIGCSHSMPNQSQEEEARRFWDEKVMPNYLQYDTSVLHVQHVRGLYSSYENTYCYDIVKTPDWCAYINKEWDVYCWADSSDIIVVNSATRETAHFLLDGNAGWNAYQSYLLNEYIAPLIDPMSTYAKWVQPEKLYDSVINGTHYKVIHFTEKVKYSRNPVTGEYDVPNFYDVFYYFNLSSKQVEQIISLPMDTTVDHSPGQKYIVSIEPFIGADHISRNIFDLNNSQYNEYSHHNDSFPPFSWRWYTGDSTSLSDDALSFPIHDLDGGTTTINQQRGWLLLDFWMYGCPACRNQLLRWKKEREENGITDVEREGIRILAINATSDNIELLAREDSICSFGKQILLHAKGIGQYIYMETMPRYYLISPDKKIVYQTTSLDDYNCLFKAMHDYQHHKHTTQ